MGNKNAKHAKNNYDIKKSEKMKKNRSKNSNKRMSKENEEDTVLVNVKIRDGEQTVDMNKKSKKDKKKKGKHKALKIVLSILLVVVIVVGFIFGKYVYDAGGSITGAVMNIVKDVMGDQDPVFVLVMGVSEDISVELTDTIILVGYNPDTNQAFMLSIPRDTFVGNSEASAGGYDKINAKYQTSPEKTVEAVENLTGVNIDYYVTVKTSALVEIVNIIGGVEYDVPINMDYDDDSQDLHIHLKAGNQVLNGDQAEQLVRFRHNNNGTSYDSEYGDNDIGRMRTQREFIKVVGNKLISTNDVNKLKEIAKSIFSNLSTDISLSKVLTYVPYVAQFDVENNLSMDQLPGAPAMINELWFYKANTAETQELINSYVEKLGLTDSEKAKYIKPISKKSTTTTQKKSTNNGSTSTPVKNTTSNNVSKNNTVTNSISNNTVTNTSSSNNAKNEINNTTNKENTDTSGESNSSGGSSQAGGNSGSSTSTSGGSQTGGDSGSSTSTSGGSQPGGDSGSSTSTSGGSQTGGNSGSSTSTSGDSQTGGSSGSSSSSSENTQGATSTASGE